VLQWVTLVAILLIVLAVYRQLGLMVTGEAESQAHAFGPQVGKEAGDRLLTLPEDSTTWRVEAWVAEAEANGIDLPLLSDAGNSIATEYGVMRWKMPSNEPGHTFVLVDGDGRIAWIRDYGAPENGGLMYVPVADLVSALREQLA
ncbi:MAG: peroxiredoxin family protein, partial [Actinomycetota bacterium]